MYLPADCVVTDCRGVLELVTLASFPLPVNGESSIIPASNSCVPPPYKILEKTDTVLTWKSMAKNLQQN